MSMVCNVNIIIKVAVCDIWYLVWGHTLDHRQSFSLYTIQSLPKEQEEF